MKPIAAIAAGIAALAVPTFAYPQERYFPLDPGNRWVYADPTARDGQTVGSITVLAIEGDVWRVDFHGRQQRVSGTPDALDIELPGEGFVPFYRFREESFLHRDFQDCDDGTRLVVGSRDEEVKTPAGTFSGCLRLDHEKGRCADAGTASEWWHPETGLVRWTESWIGGIRARELASFVRLGPSAPFLRGDADGTGDVQLTDAVYTLNHLFLGGPAPACEDAADATDDGEFNITDAILTLGFLFLGAAPPPFPGPEVAGFDGTPNDTFRCGDCPLPEPRESARSSLPGVSIDLDGNPPALTLAQAARGVTIAYRVNVEADLPGVVSDPLDAGRCDRPDSSGIAVLEMISGYGNTYCLCDTGLCLPGSSTVDLRAGTHEGTFEWDGRNWHGPSDTMNPKGDPFPPGTYEIRVRAAGSYAGPGGAEAAWEIEATRELHLVP